MDYLLTYQTWPGLRRIEGHEESNAPSRPSGQNDRPVREDRVRDEFSDAYAELYEVARAAATRFFGWASPQLVEDAIAETLTRAVERWERLRSHDRRAGWIAVTCKNVCLELLRAETRASRLLVDADQSFAPNDIAAFELAEEIKTALEQLTKRQRDCVVLRYLFGLSEVETADALGWSVSKVKNSSIEGRTRLRSLTEVFGIYATDATPDLFAQDRSR